MNLAEYAFKNKAFMYFMFVVFVVGGIFSFLTMSKLEDPEIKVKQALVVTVYPGASAHEVELEVTDGLEQAIRTMGDLDHVESRSLANVSMITVELKPTVRGAAIQQKWNILRGKVENAQPNLPSGSRKSIVMDDFGDVYGMFYALTAEGASYDEMFQYSRLVQREILRIDGVRRVEIYGDQEPCINIEINQQKLANLGVMPAEILNTINQQNKKVYSGYYKSGDERIRVAVNDTYKSIDDVTSLIIQGHEDEQLRIGDLATVTQGYSKPFSNVLRYNSENALGISISMESGGNISKLGEEIDNSLALIQQRLPVGVQFKKVFFQPDKVDFAIKDFMFNLIESVLIVIIILMIFMGIKSGFIIGYGLIITILGSFLLLMFFDGTLQRVSLASLIVAMGMLVDNAIVVIDGILIDLQSGMDRRKAMVNTAQKTARPLLGATLIAIIAFLPIFLSPDTSGEYVRDLFIVLAVSLLLSWVLALTLTPMMADKQLPKAKPTDEHKEPYQGKIYDGFRAVLRYLLWHKSMALLFTAVLLGVSLFAFKFVKKGFFPDLSYNQLYIEFKMPEGTRFETVSDKLSEIERYLLAKEEIHNVTTSVGGTPSRYNLVRSIANPSRSYGELIVDFTDADILKSSMAPLQAYLSNTYPDAFVRIKRYNLMYKKFPIEAMFSGSDPAILRQLASQAESIMRNEPLAMLVTNDWEPKSKLIVADYYQPKARSVGLSRSDIGMSLLVGNEGLPISAMQQGTESYPIYIKSVDNEGNAPSDLENLPVWSLIPSTNALNKANIQGVMMGTTTFEDILDETIVSLPLSQATKGVNVEWEEPLVNRYNGQRAIKAQCNNIVGHSAEEVRRKLKEKIDIIELPDGYSLDWQGEFQASNRSKKYLFGQLPLGIILMIAILVALFKDFKKPSIILLSLPLAIIGISFGLLVTGKEFGFVAIVGALGLIGMMIKNGVVLIDEIELQREGGKDDFHAIVDSSASRLRPVMMASLTTILGMIPLVPDDMFGGLAVTIMAGLLVGSVITLMFIPVLYAVMFKVHRPAEELQ